MHHICIEGAMGPGKYVGRGVARLVPERATQGAAIDKAVHLK